MSIPRIIHYCWFGRNPKPTLAIKCIRSWKKYCKGYEIIEWNEDNFDISASPLYVRQAYEAKKWAFVTDYVRLQVVYEHGGIYMDTDVELEKSLNPLLEYKAYFGFEDGVYVATGLGFGAEKSSTVLAEMMEDYGRIPFLLSDGKYDTTPCPARNTAILVKHGLRQDDSKQVLDEGILILPSVYLCPISYGTGMKTKSKETISIHWFSASWHSDEQRKCLEAQHKENQEAVARRKKNDRKDFFFHIPNRLLRKLVGVKRYEQLKCKLKKNG